MDREKDSPPDNGNDAQTGAKEKRVNRVQIHLIRMDRPLIYVRKHGSDPVMNYYSPTILFPGRWVLSWAFEIKHACESPYHIVWFPQQQSKYL